MRSCASVDAADCACACSVAAIVVTDGDDTLSASGVMATVTTTEPAAKATTRCRHAGTPSTAASAPRNASCTDGVNCATVMASRIVTFAVGMSWPVGSADPAAQVYPPAHGPAPCADDEAAGQ